MAGSALSVGEGLICETDRNAVIDVCRQSCDVWEELAERVAEVVSKWMGQAGEGSFAMSASSSPMRFFIV